MSEDGVVEHLDVAKDCAAGFLPCRIGLFANALTLEQLEEALRYGIVVAIASPAHAGLQVVARKKALPFIAGELAALIGMHNDGIARFSAPHSHVQGIKSQLGINAAAGGPANNLPPVQVKHCRQIQPAFMRGNVGGACNPGCVGRTDGELLLQEIGGNYGSSTAPWAWPSAVTSLGLQSFMAQ